MKRATIDFNMLVEINQRLRTNNMDYSLHAIGGCACCGVELRLNGKGRPLNEVVDSYTFGVFFFVLTIFFNELVKIQLIA